MESPSFPATALCMSGSEKEARSRRSARRAHHPRGGAQVSRMLLLAYDLAV